jgi:hypothetical protein
VSLRGQQLGKEECSRVKGEGKRSKRKKIAIKSRDY